MGVVNFFFFLASTTAQMGSRDGRDIYPRYSMEKSDLFSDEVFIDLFHIWFDWTVVFWQGRAPDLIDE